MIRTLLVLLALLFAQLTFAKPFMCEEEALAKIDQKDRVPRGEYDDDLTIVLNEVNYEGDEAEVIISKISTERNTRTQTELLPAQLFSNIPLMKIWSLMLIPYSSVDKGCKGGEILRSHMLCEKSFIHAEVKCRQQCVYTNQAEDCIPD